MPKIKHVYVNGKLVGIGNVKVEEIEKEPQYFVTVTHDSCAEYPFEFDDFIKFYSNHKHYIWDDAKLSELLNKFDDVPKSVDKLVELLNKAGEYNYLAVYGYDHSELLVSLTPFSCRWDSGLLGILRIDKNCSDPQKVAEDWVKTVNMWTHGEVYYVKITNELDDVVDDLCDVYAIDGKDLADKFSGYLSDNYKISKEDIITAYNKLYNM